MPGIGRAIVTDCPPGRLPAWMHRKGQLRMVSKKGQRARLLGVIEKHKHTMGAPSE